MKKMILIAALLVSACADSRRFYKADATLTDYQRDHYACERDTLMAYRNGGGSSVYAQMEAEAFFVRCMSAAGWTFR